MQHPITFVIFQPNPRMEKKTSMSIQKRRLTEQATPSLETFTSPKIAVEISHGRGKLFVVGSFLICHYGLICFVFENYQSYRTRHPLVFKTQGNYNKKEIENEHGRP